MVQIKGKRCGNFRVIERLFLSEGPETRLMRQEAAIFGHSKGFLSLGQFLRSILLLLLSSST